MAKKEVKDLTELFVSQVNRCRPKKDTSGTFEFVMSDDQFLGDVKYVLLTGIEPYDRLTGGFPFGRITEVFGLENCGKSAMMIRSMCRFQAKHIYEVTNKKGFIYTLKRVDPKRIRLIRAYIDNEHSLEKGFKLSIHDITHDEQGNEIKETINLEKTGIGMCDTVEHVFLAVDTFLEIISKQEKEIEEEESDELIFGVFIVDTIAGTSSKDEQEREWGEKDFPRAAAKISEGFRRLTNDIARHNVALICTNQVRTKFSIQQGSGYRAKFNTPQENDYSTYGGKALGFYATYRVFMFQMPIKYTLVKGAQFPAGFLVGFRTIKNRLRKPMREARMVLLFDDEQGGLHNSLSILDSLIFLKAAEFEEHGAGIGFKFRKFGIETTTFAENLPLDEPEVPSRRKKRLTNPKIMDRYEWFAFWKAHRTDLEKLWQAAIDKANATEGLDEYYQPDPGEEEEEEDNSQEQLPAHRPRRQHAPVISDTDLDD